MGNERRTQHVEDTSSSDGPVDMEKLPHEVGYASDTSQEAQFLNDPEIQARERKYLWRLDCIILPMISALYFFEYLDRGNIANAKLLGVNKGHATAYAGAGPGKKSLNATQWETIIMIFYVGLVLFQIPGCMGYRVFPPSKWIAFGVCFWAISSLLQDVIFNYAGLIVCRIMLGTFEGLFGTGIVYYLSLWYHRTELGVRVFWFLGPTAIAGAFGGLIAYGVDTLKTSTPNWKWLFLIEALPCFCLGLFCLYWLPDRPMHNSRFEGEQQKIAEARYVSELVDKAGPMQKKHIIWVFTDWKLYAQAAIYLPTAALLASISGFLPTIVQDLGYKSSTSANLMTVPPYACAFVLMFLTSWSSDRLHDRGIHITVLSSIAAICYLTMALLPEDRLHAKYALTCVSVATVYSTYPPSHAWAANNFGNETKRAIGMGAYTALGNLGSIAGSWFYPTTQAPEYRQGHLICFGMSLAAAIISLGNSLALGAVNRRRDRREGKPVKGRPVEVSEDADGGVGFRFIT